MNPGCGVHAKLCQLKVNFEIGWFASYTKCGRNLAKPRFFTNCLAAAPMLPGDPSVQGEVGFVYDLVMGQLLGSLLERVVVCDRL